MRMREYLEKIAAHFQTSTQSVVQLVACRDQMRRAIFPAMGSSPQSATVTSQVDPLLRSRADNALCLTAKVSRLIERNFSTCGVTTQWLGVNAS